MTILDQKEYAKIHEDYKGIYSSDEIHGTKFNGKKTWLRWIENVGTVLLIEDQDFKLVDLDEDGCYDVECGECDGEGSYDVMDCKDFSNECCGGCTKNVECENCKGSGSVKKDYESELIN